MREKQILVVGQCGVDGPRIQEFLEGLDPSFNVERLQSDAELEGDAVSGADLVLFNRQLVGEFESPEGVELIRELHERYPDVKLMLVSDLPEAQREAEQAGAIEGFGKSDLESPAVAELVRKAVGGSKAN